MATVHATVELPCQPAEAEALWYDTDRWSAWIDGLDEILSIEGPWPRAGGTLVWQSNPAGRGRVTEHVVEYEPGASQTAEVEDETLAGRQTVEFIPAADGIAVTLSLDYRLAKRSPLMAVVDVLFIRRAVRASLRNTLERFGAELSSSRFTGEQ